MIGFFVVLLVVGIVWVILGCVIDTHNGFDGFLVVAGFALAFSGFLGTTITAGIEGDKKECLNATAEISGKETKWLDGECYMKANDGKFVPQEWIEKGYNDK